MPSTEVQRTLVKSPPELWAELSDPASLARHLCELGEIQLTCVEPESAVEWEAANVKGSVQLKASGWGTKVTFSLTRELPQELLAECEPAAAPEQALAEPEPQASEPEPPIIKPEPSEAATESALQIPEPELPTPEPEPAMTEPDATPEPERTPRRGFFARLLKRWRKEAVAEICEPDAEPTEPEAPVTVAEEPAAVAEEPAADPATPPTPEATRAADALELPAEAQLESPAEAAQESPADAREESQSPDLAAELAAMEQTMVEQDTALLSAVLDRLGAAHHRPFSRG